MKARLLTFQDVTTLLLNTGKIIKVSNIEAREFLLNFNDNKYYDGPDKWNYENLSMEDYRGETIAYVCDKGILHVENAELFRQILENLESNFITVQEYATMHGKKPAIVRRFCQNGRIYGAVQKGKTWLIPANSPYPPDERVKY